jgi:hypothetical protein
VRTLHSILHLGRNPLTRPLAEEVSKTARPWSRPRRTPDILDDACWGEATPTEGDTIKASIFHSRSQIMTIRKLSPIITATHEAAYLSRSLMSFPVFGLTR